MKGKLERERNACPTHLVLRQEDGAVRPEKKIALETQSRVVTKRNAKDTRNERIARPEEKVALDTLEKEDRAVRPEENTALLCRNETKRELIAKRTNCPPRRRGYLDTLVKEDRAVRPEENTALLCLLYSVSVRKRHILDCQRLGSRITHCSPVHTRPGGQHSSTVWWVRRPFSISSGNF